MLQHSITFAYELSLSAFLICAFDLRFCENKVVMS